MHAERGEERPSRLRRVVWLAILLCVLAEMFVLGVLRIQGASGLPAPEISSVGLPTDPTGQRSVRFMFTDAQTVTFLCSLDGSPFVRCGYGLFGSKSYAGPLARGRHRFRVRAALLQARSQAASFTWTIVKAGPGHEGHGQKPHPDTPAGTDTGSGVPQGTPSQGGTSQGASSQGGTSDGGGSQGNGSAGGGSPGAGQPPAIEDVAFEVSGDVVGLAPGVTKAIVLELMNPNTFPIYVTSVSVEISAGSKPPGCSSAANVLLHQATGITSGSPVTVPAGSTVTVSTYPRAPEITLRNLASNQDGCKNKKFTLTYAGSAHS